MSVAGMPSRGLAGIQGDTSGMSSQEQMMVKTVCPQLTTSREEIGGLGYRTMLWKQTTETERNSRLMFAIDTRCHAKLPGEDRHGWRDGLRARRGVWVVHVECK